MRKFLSVFIFALLFFLFGTKNISAQTPPPLFTIGTATSEVNESMNRVTISFGDATENNLVLENTLVCLRGDACSFETLGEPPEKRKKLLERSGPGTASIDKNAARFPLSRTTTSFTVCADGEYNLKIDLPASPPADKCSNNDTYFYPGSIYYVTLYAPQGSKYVAVGMASFYVKHNPPGLAVSSITNFLPQMPDPADSNKNIYANITATITKSTLFQDKNSNNYQLILEGPGYKNEQCISFTSGDPGPKSKTWPQSGVDKVNYLQPGVYTIKVNEQISEELPWDGCSGGYTYVHQICTISYQNPKPPDPSTACKNAVPDPNKSELGKDGLSLPAKPGFNVALPCRIYDNGVPISASGNDPTRCSEFTTAIGGINLLSPAAFITRIFSIILSIAGFGATALIIYSGYRLLTSRGNKETIQAARETITSAIIGLVFIILSIVILSIIGSGILRIPGFA